MLLADAVELFLSQKAAEGLSPRSLIGYRKLLRQLVLALKRLGVRHAADATANDLDSVFVDLAERGLAHSTRLSYASRTTEFFRCLQAQGLVLRNPALDLPVPDSDEDVLPPAPLEDREISALMAAIPRDGVIGLRDAAHVQVLYGCALRLRESLMLDVDDIDFTEREVAVRAGKGGQTGVVPLGKRTAAVLRDYLTERRSLLKGPDHGALFLNNRGQRVHECMVRQALLRAAPVAGIDRRVHPHLLRHSAAVALMRGGGDVVDVQRLLRHASLTHTKRYLRMVPGHLREEYDRAMPEIVVDG